MTKFAVILASCYLIVFFFFKQKTAYEIYQCDWSSDVCSSDLLQKLISSYPFCEQLTLSISRAAFWRWLDGFVNSLLSYKKARLSGAACTCHDNELSPRSIPMCLVFYLTHR